MKAEASAAATDSATDKPAAAAPPMPDNRKVPFHFLTREKVTKPANCEGCNKGFGIFTHRHHCRRCGHCFCWDCTPYAVEGVYPDGKLATTKEPAKMCEKCYLAPRLHPFNVTFDDGKEVRVTITNRLLEAGGIESTLEVCSLGTGDVLLTRTFDNGAVCAGPGTPQGAHHHRPVVVGMWDKVVRVVNLAPESLFAHADGPSGDAAPAASA